MLRRNPFSVVVLILAGSAYGDDSGMKAWMQAIRGVEAHGRGHREAAAAWKALAQLDASRLPQVLAGMRGAGPLAENWIRSAAEAIAEREVARGRQLPVPALEAFLADVAQSPRARRLAYELIARVDPAAERRLVPRLADDPSVELRRDAVALLIKEADGIETQAGKTRALEAYRRALASARDLDQIDHCSKKLKELGEVPDLVRHFGFIRSWKLIGPFDNTGTQGFDVPYPPEQSIDLAASYVGKSGEVRWLDHSTPDERGMVDLNKGLGKHMGAIAYAFAEFDSPGDRSVQLRLGSSNGTKIWLNGELLTANHVYHTGVQIDQYVVAGQLRQGRNTILLKIAQNEQTEDWAQNWHFQFRVCDSVGTAILSQK